MWYRFTCRMPYYGDPDFRQSLIDSVKSRLNGASVDVTLLEKWGIVEVLTDDPEELGRIPMVGSVTSAVDRGILSGSRVVV